MSFTDANIWYNKWIIGTLKLQIVSPLFALPYMLCGVRVRVCVCVHRTELDLTTPQAREAERKKAEKKKKMDALMERKKPATAEREKAEAAVKKKQKELKKAERALKKKEKIVSKILDIEVWELISPDICNYICIWTKVTSIFNCASNWISIYF